MNRDTDVRRNIYQGKLLLRNGTAVIGTTLQTRRNTSRITAVYYGTNGKFREPLLLALFTLRRGVASQRFRNFGTMPIRHDWSSPNVSQASKTRKTIFHIFSAKSDVKMNKFSFWKHYVSKLFLLYILHVSYDTLKSPSYVPKPNKKNIYLKTTLRSFCKKHGTRRLLVSEATKVFCSKGKGKRYTTHVYLLLTPCAQSKLSRAQPASMYTGTITEYLPKQWSVDLGCDNVCVFNKDLGACVQQ